MRGEAELAACPRGAGLVGFAAFADRPGNSLSFGQRRIVEIARTLTAIKIVLLDSWRWG
jgi:ABC-type branched-subunit amino acid transport system ATPase component